MSCHKIQARNRAKKACFGTKLAHDPPILGHGPCMHQAIVSRAREGRKTGKTVLWTDFFIPPVQRKTPTGLATFSVIVTWSVSHLPHILRGASSSSRMGWLRNNSLDLRHSPLISPSVSCTFFPGLEPLTTELTHRELS